MRTNISGETIEMEVAIYYAWMKDDPSMNQFYFYYLIKDNFFDL